MPNLHPADRQSDGSSDFRAAALRPARPAGGHAVPLHQVEPTRPRQRGVRLGLAAVLSLSVVAGLALAGAEPAAAANQATTLKPQAMSFTNHGSPKKNYSAQKELYFSKSQYRTYLKYDTSAIKAKSTIVSAELELVVTTSKATKPKIDVRTTSTKWTAAGLTWNSMPKAAPTIINAGSKVVPKKNTKVVTKLTGLKGKPIGSALSLQLAYSVGSTTIHLSKSARPVLRLVTAPPSPTDTAVAPTIPAPTPSVPLVGPDQIPYTTPPVSRTEKKVFAHYFPPYPISLDNKPMDSDYYARHYLNPAGENGKFRAVGGLLRDRPVGRPVRTGDYKLADAETEVRQAAAAGVEGFLTDIMNFNGQSWTASLALSEAAAKSGTGFVVAPNVDMTASTKDASVTTMAYYLAQFYKTPGAYRLPDGRYLLSTFKAENKPATYWKAVIAELKTKHHVDVAFVGILLSISDAQIAEYAPISYALGVWGARDADLTMRTRNRAADVQKLGVKWMAPVAVQDVRHDGLTFAESNNTELLRATWSRAISDGADFAQLLTWNDYSESTTFAPSTAHRSAFLDVNGYYANQFKSGAKPALRGDELVVTHRIQKVGTKPTVQTSVMASTLAGSRTAPRDTVEVLSMLAAPATVTLKVGGTTKTVEAPAGVSQFTLPLTTGTVSAAATRKGQSVATVTSPHKVVSSVDYWNLQYYAATSRENPTR